MRPKWRTAFQSSHQSSINSVNICFLHCVLIPLKFPLMCLRAPGIKHQCMSDKDAMCAIHIVCDQTYKVLLYTHSIEISVWTRLGSNSIASSCLNCRNNLPNWPQYTMLSPTMQASVQRPLWQLHPGGARHMPQAYCLATPQLSLAPEAGLHP